jgi:hypothetical protein
MQKQDFFQDRPAEFPENTVQIPAFLDAQSQISGLFA